jgi:hypothetical protein
VSEKGERAVGRHVALAASLLAVAVLIKPTTILFTVGFFVAAAADLEQMPASRLKTTAALMSGVGLAALAQLAWNAYRFGSPFDFGYDWAETIPMLPARPFAVADVPRGLVVLLLSPGKSLFLWAPALVCSIVAARRFWEMHRAAALGIASTAAVVILTFAGYQFPEGGYAHGPRHLVPMIPLLLLPAAASNIKWPRAALAVCAAVGLTMAVLATSVSFLEDQGLGGDLRAGARTVYYDRIDPAPGRPWNRYRIQYVPFLNTLRSVEWRHATTLGQGPDYFPVHLAQLREASGGAIPSGLIYAWPIGWFVLLAGGGSLLRRGSGMEQTA